ncbi:MAG: hypothetical protein J1F35_01945 [Erysipelotrichales bacterium]|nr:hypothetical protein [Erysipelotrichales bacterium]
MKKKNKQTEIKRFESTEIKQSAFINEDYKTFKTFIIVLIIVLTLLGLLFFFNAKLVTKDMFNDETTTTAPVSYIDTTILADHILGTNNPHYMVLLYDTEDKTSNILYDSLFNNYSGDEDLYAVDLANKMNASHYDKNQENENKSPKTNEEIVVSGPTLLVVKENKVVEYITDAKKIQEKLNN